MYTFNVAIKYFEEKFIVKRFYICDAENFESYSVFLKLYSYSHKIVINYIKISFYNVDNQEVNCIQED